ncbi:UNVERIFIED_ORG: hypothetical protein FHR35_007454 [Microbispora rosea subsp. rosea]
MAGRFFERGDEVKESPTGERKTGSANRSWVTYLSQMSCDGIRIFCESDYF